MKYIGIDMGSSFTKAILLDLEQGTVLAHESYPSPERLPSDNPLVFEISAQILTQNVRDLVDRYTKLYSDIQGIVISTQMHGFVYTSGQEDRYVSWQDMRCTDPMPGTKESYLDILTGQISRDDMVDNGVYLKPSLGMCNLYTLLQQNPALPQNGRLYTLGSYVIWNLTGNNVCHISNAAPLGLADVQHHCWDETMLMRLGFDGMELPRLAESDFEVCGTYCSNGQTLNVYPDYGDMQVAILGSMIKKDEVVINIGTGSQVIRFCGDFEPGPYEIRPYFEHAYLNTISNMPGGRNLDVLIQLFRDAVKQLTGTDIPAGQVWDTVHRTECTDRDTLRMKTCFYQNPYYPDGGTIEGITQNNLQISTIFAAAYRDMAETYWRHIQDLGGHSEQIHNIVCAGGVSWKNPEILHALTDETGCNIRLSPIPEEALNGVYRLCLVCSGIHQTLSDGADHVLRLNEKE